MFLTNEQLTEIYNDANGLNPKRHNPITTERIFTAMREAARREIEACITRMQETPVLVPGNHDYTALKVQQMMIDAVSSLLGGAK